MRKSEYNSYYLCSVIFKIITIYGLTNYLNINIFVIKL